MKKLRQYPVLVLFFAAILVIGVANLLVPDKKTSETENRELQQMPHISFSSLIDSSERGFAQKYEKYLSDQFVGRDMWITAKSVVEALLGKTENNGIAYGSDSYLFGIYRTCDEDNLQKNVEWLTDFAAAHPDLQKDAMIVPSSYTILADKTPAHLGNLDENAKISDMYAALSEAGYDTIDTAASLTQHADEYIYYRNDHHWTTLGALYAYTGYAEETGFTAVVPAAAALHEQEGFLGTYYNKAKKFNAVADTLSWYDVDIDGVTIGGESADGLYDLDKLSTRDQYAMFLHGNNGVTVITNSKAEGGSILVVKDSYANCFVPFLTQSFSSVTVVDLRYLPTGFEELLTDGDFDRMLVLYNFENFASDSNVYRLMY